jgi:hypothetical protein
MKILAVILLLLTYIAFYGGDSKAVNTVKKDTALEAKACRAIYPNSWVDNCN